VPGSEEATPLVDPIVGRGFPVVALMPSELGNWYSPSYSPGTGLFYLSIWDNYGSIYSPQPAEYRAGQVFGGGFTGSCGFFTGLRAALSAAVLMSSINLVTRAALLPRSLSK